MLKDNKFLKGLNGKKLPITLLITMIGGGIGYGELKQKVATHSEDIGELKPIIAQIARIDERVNHTKGEVKEMKLDLKDFRKEQKADNEKLYQAILAK